MKLYIRIIAFIIILLLLWWLYEYLTEDNILYDKISSDKWKNKILNIYNNDDLVIIYKWSYDINNDKWIILIDESFQKFCNDNNIKVCDHFTEFFDDNYDSYLFTKQDNYLINNKVLCTTNYHETPQNIIRFNPSSISKKVYSKACNIDNDNFISFPVGIYNRDTIDDKYIKTYRKRTSESIKTLILNNYLNNSKSIKNYIYFLQTIRLNSDSIKYNPLYVKICNYCKDNKITTHTMDQDEHWYNLNNHLFNLCVSWNTLESPRLWESLYFGCIPIVIDYYEPNNFIEKYYYDLPILHIKNIDDLSEEFIINKYKYIMSNIDNYNFDKLKLSYWKTVLKKN